MKWCQNKQNVYGWTFNSFKASRQKIESCLWDFKGHKNVLQLTLVDKTLLHDILLEGLLKKKSFDEIQTRFFGDYSS